MKGTAPRGRARRLAAPGGITDDGRHETDRPLAPGHVRRPTRRRGAVGWRNSARRIAPGAFLMGLQEAGYAQGRNVLLESRYAHADLGRFPALARELVELKVAAIVTSNPYATRAAREASGT